MLNKAYFTFDSEFNIFLLNANKDKEFVFEFKDNPSIKDSIESLGVPHTEVYLIKVNGISVDFNYLLKDQNKVLICSQNYSPEAKENTILRTAITEYKFMVDANIGKMAKYLRMMGFDTYYDLSIDDKEIVAIAEKQNRIILTRDVGLLKRKNAINGYFLRATDIKEQVIEVLKRYELANKIKSFSLCFECNSKLEEVKKESVKDKVPERVYLERDHFYECKTCQKLFWKGSHHTKMLNDIELLKKESII